MDLPSSYSQHSISNFHLSLIQSTPLAYNGLRANEGRETKALNCKPNTNLKEIFEPSN